MHDGKWIDGLSADMPLPQAARVALAARLDAVGRCLPAALRQSGEDVEHIHRLRVATRRARAALDIFASCLDEKTYAAGKKQLRKIRRAAGAARDWDVVLASLTGPRPRPAALHQSGRDLLIGYALAQRGAAQAQVADLGDDYPDRFEKLQALVLAGVQTRRVRQTLNQLAPTLLADLANRVDQGLAGDLGDYARLHQVRIDGKRLRYAIEIFADCFAPALRERYYPLVEAMQEILGDANDSHVALAHLHEVLALSAYLPPRAAKKYRPGIDALQQFYERRLQEQRQKFGRWQAEWHKVERLQKILAAPPDGWPSACST